MERESAGRWGAGGGWGKPGLGTGRLARGAWFGVGMASGAVLGASAQARLCLGFGGG